MLSLCTIVLLGEDQEKIFLVLIYVLVLSLSLHLCSGCR